MTCPTPLPNRGKKKQYSFTAIGNICPLSRIYLLGPAARFGASGRDRVIFLNLVDEKQQRNTVLRQVAGIGCKGVKPAAKRLITSIATDGANRLVDKWLSFILARKKTGESLINQQRKGKLETEECRRPAEAIIQPVC